MCNCLPSWLESWFNNVTDSKYYDYCINKHISFQRMRVLQLQHWHRKVHSPLRTVVSPTLQEWKILVWVCVLLWPDYHRQLGYTGGGLVCRWNQCEYLVFFAQKRMSHKAIDPAALMHSSVRCMPCWPRHSFINWLCKSNNIKSFYLIFWITKLTLPSVKEKLM